VNRKKRISESFLQIPPIVSGGNDRGTIELFLAFDLK